MSGRIIGKGPNFNVKVPDLEYVKYNYDHYDHAIYASVIFLSIVVCSLYFFQEVDMNAFEIGFMKNIKIIGNIVFIAVIVTLTINVVFYFKQVKSDADIEITKGVAKMQKMLYEDAYAKGQEDALSGDIRYNIKYDCWDYSPYDQRLIKLAGKTKMCRDIK